MPEYSSAQGPAVERPPWNRGPMTSVDGTYAPPAPGRSNGIPSSFGNSTDMATAFVGALSDMRAVSQETIKVLGEIGIMAHRVSAMLGNSTGMVTPAGPNSSFPSSSGASVGASITRSLALGYGFGGANMALPVGMSNIAAQTFGQGFGSAAPVPVGAGGTGGPVPATPLGTPGTDTSWIPATPDDKKESESAIKIRTFLEGEAGEKFLSNKGDKTFSSSRQQGSSVSGIAQRLAQHIQSARGWPTDGEATLDQLSRSQRNRIIRMGTATKGYRPSEANVAALQALRQGGTVAADATGVRAAVSSIANGGGLEEASGALFGDSLAGPIGLGLGAAALGVHEMENQRAINSQIQSQIGGSNWSAFGTRAQGLMFGLSHLGMMGMGQSNQAFMGVTDLGLTGSAKSNALNFITSNYSSMGMSIADSMQLVATSVKAGNANLQQLATTLDAVTQSAAAAGVNTEQARQSFASMYTSAINSGMLAPSASTYAGASTMMASHFGQMGVGLQFGQASGAQAAAAAGVSLGQYYAKIGAGGVGAAQFQAHAQDAVVRQMMAGVGSGIPNIQALARAQYNKRQGPNGGFAQAMMNSGMTPQVMTQILSTAGIKGVTAQNVWEVAAGALTGQENLGSSVSVTHAQQLMSGDVNSEIANMRNTMRRNPGRGGLGAAMSSISSEYTSAEHNVSNYMVGRSTASTQNLQALASHDMSGMISIGGKQMQVQQALNDPHLMAQLASGRGVSVIDGSGNKTVGLSGWASKYAASDASKTSKGAKQGGGKGSVGTVTVNLSPQAAQLLALTTSGAAVLGNNTATINSAPTQDPVSFWGS